MMQCNDTKTLNLNQDFEEVMSKAQQTGWNGSTKTKVSGQKKRKTTRDQIALRSKPQMESMMSFEAEWVILEVMKVLKVVCVLTSVWTREWQYEDILNDIDGLVWEESPAL